MKNAGSWSHTEELKFAKGVELFGWQKWTRIAEYVETRDSNQVRNFSRTARAMKYEPGHSSLLSTATHGLKSTADALKSAAEGLKDVVSIVSKEGGVEGERSAKD